MPRVLLILCYLISVLAGPQPCCCAAPTTSPTQPTTTKTTAPTKGCPRCAVAEKANPAPKQDQPPPAKKQNCPCPKAEVNAPVVPPAVDDTRQHVTPIGLPIGFTPVVSLFAHGTHITIVGPPPDPSAHLLQLCHRLRC